MNTQFRFVLTGDFGKTASADRRIIRSKCMQGKNQRIGSRRYKQQESRSAKKKVDEQVDVQKESHAALLSTHTTSQTSNMQQQVQVPTPLAPPSDFSLIELPGDLGLHSDELLYKFLTYGAVRALVAPIEVCVNVDPLKPDYFSWPFYDVTFFHAALLVTSATNDYFLSRSLSQATVFHLRRTLHFLNKKLAHEDAWLEDSNVYVIVMLTLMAVSFGDYTAAGAHMDGLRRIVELRGGIEYLQSTPKLHYKLDRLDLSWCLGFGGVPRFSDTEISWESTFPYSPFDSSMHNALTDHRLAAVFNDVKHLVHLINVHFAKNTKFHGEAFQASISSIQSRLLLLKDLLRDVSAMDEMVCLAMLAFMTTTFQIPGRKVPYWDLRRKLRKAIDRVWAARGGSEVGVWVLVIGAISVLDKAEDEGWLVEKWKEVAEDGVEWEVVKMRLQRVLWIDSIHDRLGKGLFDMMIDRGVVSIA